MRWNLSRGIGHPQVTTAAVLMTGFLVLCPARGLCAVWTVRPGAEALVGYDSNITLVRGSEIDAYLATLGLTLDSGVKTERSDLVLSCGASARRYLGEPDLNDEIWRASLRGRHEFGERLGAGVNLGYLRDTTMDSEFDQTGEVVTRTPRRRYRGSLDLRYLPTETAELKLAGEHDEIRYQEFGNRDSSADGVTLEIGHRLKSEIGRIVLRPSFTSQRSAVADTESVSLEAGWLQAKSETLDLHAYLGVRRSSLSPSGGAEETDWGILADLGMERRWELTSLRLAYTRTITYGLSATPIETDRLSLGQRFRISPRLVQEATGQISLARRIIDEARERTARYGSATLRFLWTGNERIQLGASYSLEMYRSEDPDRDATARRHRIWVSIITGFDLLG